jgi:hypothetical protein
MDRTKRYRVAQWATGVTGSAALRAVIDHPQYDLVAVRVYSDEKVGKDAGDICGRQKTGVLATRNIEDVIAAKPDCVLYMPHSDSDFDDLARLLESGINIVTTRWEFNHRETLPPAVRQKLEAACAKGRTSLYPTGSTPGFSTEILPLAFTSIMRRIDCITILESSGDMSKRGSPMMHFESGFGRDMATIDPSEPHITARTTPPSLRSTVEALGLEYDEIVCTRQYAAAKHDVHFTGGGMIEAGTVGGQRMEIAVIRGGKPVLRRQTDWLVTLDLEPQWEVRPRGWRYIIESDVPLDITIGYGLPDEQFPTIVGSLGANTSVNAIPYVCEAEPGLKHTNELPTIIGNFSRS